MKAEQIYVTYDETERVIEDTFNHEDYSGFNETEKTCKITGVSLTRPTNSNYESFENKQKFQVGEKGYLVVVTYSDGGTFSRTSGYIKIAEICRDLDTAINYKEAIEKDSVQEHSRRYDSTKGSERSYIPSNGQNYRPWEGYFSSLENVEIVEFGLQNKSAVSYKV